jgi:bacterioferritin (cytochrome b1)
MNFDDIMNGGLSPKSNIGENITDIFNVDESFAMKTTRDLVNLTTSKDSSDADIIQSALAMCETKTEVAVVMYLTSKALVNRLVDEMEEASMLLEDTKDVIKEIGGEFEMQFAKGMMERLMKRMEDGIFGSDDEE